MGLDIWFKDDIANILRAANEANLSALAAGEDVVGASGIRNNEAAELRHAYRRGFTAALVTMALALGLPAPSVEDPCASQGVGAPRDTRNSDGRALPAALTGGKKWER